MMTDEIARVCDNPKHVLLENQYCLVMVDDRHMQHLGNVLAGIYCGQR
jgi:hypothetical protein